MFKKSIFTLILSGAIVSTAYASPWKLVEDTYVVHHGDTLSSISQEYMKKNTYAEREIREFTSGIQELNPELISRDVKEGEKIRINYWIKNK